MNGELITDIINPEDTLEIKGKLKVKDSVTMDSIEAIQSLSSVMNEDQIKDSSILISRGDDATIAGISVLDALIPPGTIFPFGASTIPQGWLPCDGTLYDSEPVGHENPFYRLFQSIGFEWGKDGTRFRVPDLRGRFIRGFDDGQGNDPDSNDRRTLNSDGSISNIITGDAVGSYQEDAFQGHWHLNNADHGSGSSEISRQGVGGYQIFQYNQIRDAINDGVNGDPRYSSETRPQNAAVHYIIKY